MVNLCFFPTFIIYKPPLRLQNLDSLSILMNFSFLCLHYMVVSVVYLFLDGTLSCFSALNPDKWLEFKLQEKATVSHNSQLFR